MFIMEEPVCYCFLPRLLKYRQRSEGFIYKEVLLCILGLCLRGSVEKNFQQTLFVYVGMCQVIITGNLRFLI